MEKHGDDNKVQLLKRKGRVKNSHWALKATIITFFTSAFFSFVAESTESNGNLIVIVVLLLFLIVGNVVFDGIGIAAATADETEVKRLSKHCGRSEKIAIYIVENADIVSNVCNDERITQWKLSIYTNLRTLVVADGCFKFITDFVSAR